MASFDAFLTLLLRFEGGFVDNPADPGGATNKGITMRTFGRAALPLLGIEPTPSNLHDLTDQQAGVLYKNLYWDKVQADAIDLQALADIVVDFYVNAGGHAIELLKQVLNSAGAAPALPLNGVMDEPTCCAMRRLDQHQVYRRYREGRIAYYQRLVERRPTLQCFLRGWLNRVNAFPVL